MLAHINIETTLLGIGLYTPSEAERLIRVPARKLARWLRGHTVGSQFYAPLWARQVKIVEEEVVLGFRDLVQARVVAALIREGLSPHKVRQAIILAEEILATDHPFTNGRFRTDGSTLLIQSLEPGEDDKLIDLFRGGQYVMRAVIEPSLRGVEFEAGLAVRWWPAGKRAGIVVDPERQFGQPIDSETGVPTTILARAALAEGSIGSAARAYAVSEASIRRAMTFERQLAA